MTKFLFAVLPMLFVSWFFACPISAQDTALPPPYQVLEVQDCPHGNRCFLAGRGATASQMLARVNRGIADETRRVTMADLEAANPCDVSYVREDGSAKRNGLCPEMNGSTERVTWENFCGGHTCQRWVIASYPGRLRVYRVPTRHRPASGERIEQSAPLPDESPPAVTAMPVPVVAPATPSGASAIAQAATPSPDLSLQRRIAQLTRERDEARRALRESGTDWTLFGSLTGCALVLALLMFYWGTTRAQVTTVNLSADEVRGWNDKVQAAERRSDALKGKLQEAEAKVREVSALVDGYEKPLTAMRALYQTKMNAELTPQRLDETIKGCKAHTVLESALGGLSANAVKQAVTDAGAYRSLKAAWETNFPTLGFNALSFASVPVQHKQAVDKALEALCATHNAEIEDLKRSMATGNGQGEDAVSALLTRLSTELWTPLRALDRGEFGSLLTLDESGARVVNADKVKERFGFTGEFTHRGRRGGRNNGDLKALQLTTFLRGVHEQLAKAVRILDGIIAIPSESGLDSLFDDRDDEATSEIVLQRDASGAKALPEEPTRVVTDSSKPDPET